MNDVNARIYSGMFAVASGTRQKLNKQKGDTAII